MAKQVSADRWMFASIVVLVFIGLVMVFSASAVMAQERYGSAYGFLVRQLVGAAAGFLAMWVLMNVDYCKLRHPAVAFSLVGTSTVLLVGVFFYSSHNVHRWLPLGPLSFQPAELAKLAIIVYVAYFLATHSEDVDDWRRVLLPAIVPTVVFAALIVKQPDLGTAMMCVAITAAMLFVAGTRLRYFGYALLASLPLLYLLIFRVPWRRKRILVFLDPFADPQGAGFQSIQSLIAVGTGGLSGQGLMEGKQKLFYLPEPHTDFIFAVISEELGLLGAMVVIALFALFCYRGLRAALRTSDPFGRLLATGVTAMVGIQALFNLSVVLSLLPNKGIPLPFISYGGSSVMVMLAGVGVLLNISKQAE